MAGLIDFLVFDLMMGDEAEKERPAMKRRSVIFEPPAEKSRKKKAPGKKIKGKKQK